MRLVISWRRLAWVRDQDMHCGMSEPDGIFLIALFQMDYWKKDKALVRL